MPKCCSECKKELGEILSFKCRHCNQFFCIDHFLPENHNCPNFKSEPITEKYIPTSKQSIPSDVGPKDWLEEKPKETKKEPVILPTQEPIIKVEKIKHKEKNLVKPAVILMIIIVLLSAVSASGYYVFKQSYDASIKEKQNFENELDKNQKNLDNSKSTRDALENNLSQCEVSLDENFSEVKTLKSGDKYHLHDPTYKEVYDFFEENINETSLNKLIENAKNQGIRCAYVMIGLESGTMIELIGFDTLDNDMVYLEPTTHYLVYPKIGLNYYDCVYNQPYGPSTPQDKDKITEILVVW